MLDLQIAATWRLADGTAVAISPKLVQVLKAIERHGSILATSKATAIPYRTLWAIIQQNGEALKQELVHTQGRGGASLTPFGHKLVWMIEQGHVRLGADLGMATERLNVEWSESDPDKPWLNMDLSDDTLLAELLDRGDVHQHVQLSLRWSGSIAALSALHRGEVTIAGCHLPVGLPANSELYSTMRRWLRGDDLMVIELLDRELGWISRTGGRPFTLNDVAQGQAQLVNRNPSSATHLLLNTLLAEQGFEPKRMPGYFHEENSHLAVACSIAAGHGDLGLGIHAAAARYGLHFRRLGKERYFLVLHAAHLQQPGVQALLAWLENQNLNNMPLSECGYTASKFGKVQPLGGFLRAIETG